VLVKISGEAFCAAGGFGIDPEVVEALVGELAPLHEMQVEVGLVVGGGNFLRGKTLAEAEFIQRATADAMGMLATVMNGLALQDALEHRGVPTRVLSAIPTAGVCEPFARRRALHHLEQRRVVILAGGTGSPFFTTDTCSALRASELGADVLLKATKVDGVFEADPLKHPDARKFDRLTYGQVLAKQLGVMDLAAVSLCMESRIPVIVFRLGTPGNLAAAVRGEAVGTMISAD
jgi:uridylate kinase